MISFGIVFWFLTWLFCMVMWFVNVVEVIIHIVDQCNRQRYLKSMWFWCFCEIVCAVTLQCLMGAMR